MPDDLRLKFAQCQPITAGLPHPPMMLNPISILPHTNLPQNLPLVQHEPPQNFSIKDPHLLKPPQVLGVGEYTEKFVFSSAVMCQLYFRNGNSRSLEIVCNTCLDVMFYPGIQKLRRKGLDLQRLLAQAMLPSDIAKWHSYVTSFSYHDVIIPNAKFPLITMLLDRST